MSYSTLEFKDIKLRHNKSVSASRADCNTWAKLGNHEFSVPVIPANMPAIINYDICKILDSYSWAYIYHRIHGTEDVFQFVLKAQKDLNIVSISVGIKEEWLKLVYNLYRKEFRVDFFTVDVALSYNDNVLPILDTIKRLYPSAYVILGNGCTGEWVEWVESLGMVDAIKVGIGVSKSCRTAQSTGYGSYSAGSLLECAAAAKNLTVISDGGLTSENDEVWVGDVNKALILGADWILSGALFKSCNESPALTEGYYGNASARSKGNSRVEGATVPVQPSEKSLVETMLWIKESIQSGISYSGGRDIAEMKELGEWDSKMSLE